MDKPIRLYSQIVSPAIEIGHSARLVIPGWPYDKLAITTPVISYDETTETIETQNTVYIPA